jgi:hypothetical protein
MAMTALRRVVRAGRNYELTWRYLFNFAPTLSYRFARPLIEGEAAQILSDLNRDGIAKISTQALFGGDSCFNELFEAFTSLRDSQAKQLEAARGDENEQVGEKSFIFEYLGARPLLEPNQIYARFALHEKILQIANAYLGMHTRLRYYNIWHTFTTKELARQSQLWHRDREDRYILKVFVYLSDVGEGAGPLTYAAGSHTKGDVKTKPEFFLEGGVERSTDDQMAKVAPPERWIKATGQKGTIVFADTRGYHKGGLAREQDRILYTCMFTSPASESKEFMQRTTGIQYPLEKALAYALAAPKGGAWLRLRPRGFDIS